MSKRSQPSQCPRSALATLAWWLVVDWRVWIAENDTTCGGVDEVDDLPPEVEELGATENDEDDGRKVCYATSCFNAFFYVGLKGY